MEENSKDLAARKAKRLAILLGLFLFGFTSPFQARGCTPVGFHCRISILTMPKR
jgi:hypothetical protein